MKESRDILTLFEALSSHEVFTPPRVARAMLDLLPQTLWSDPSIRLLDPCAKSGVFLREAFFRFFSGLEGKGSHVGHDGNTYDLNDRQQRVNHILKNMLYGIAISELTSYMARRTLYGVMRADTDKQIASIESFERSSNYQNWSERDRLDFIGRNVFNDYYDHRLFCTAQHKGFESEGNIFYPVEEVTTKVVEEGSYEIEDTYFPFIDDRTQHKKIRDIRSGKMKFDVIVGNPPYQVSDGAGGKGSSAKPVYQHFVMSAVDLNPRYMSMIIPSRWFTDGKGLDTFRDRMLSDKRMKRLVDHQSSLACFPGVDIAGGVCYFLWDQKHKGLCQVSSIGPHGESQGPRDLGQFKTFVRDVKALSIIEKIQSQKETMLNEVALSRNPFGIESSVRPCGRGTITLVHSSGQGMIPESQVLRNKELIGKWKAVASKVSYDHAGMPDKNGQRKVLSKVFVLEPDQVCSETYLVIGVFDTECEAQNMVAYMKTKLFRFLVSVLSVTQNITKEKFGLVPVLDMTVTWTDEALFKKYGISDDEINHLNRLIKEMP